MKKIAVVTSTRAEYGILTPLIRRIYEDRDLELELLVTGTHLSEKYGHTVDEIKKDGFPIAKEIPILSEDNSSIGISETMANALSGFAKAFEELFPDLVIILGDRTEMLGVAAAALNSRIPIAHIHGGEITEGAVDDCIRHAITKMSYLHFPSTEIYRRRIIELGESPDRVFNFGALSTENILNVPLYKESEIRTELSIPKGKKYSVVTFHPVTLESDSAGKETKALISAMEKHDEDFYLITMANADNGSDIVNELIRNFAEENPDRAKLVSSLGMKRYLSAVKYADFVLGNSSSGIIEAPVLGIPTVNIGDRQKGRLRADTIIDCAPVECDISDAIDKAENEQHKATLLYGDGHTSERIVNTIKDFLLNDKIDLKKHFYDVLPVDGKNIA